MLGRLLLRAVVQHKDVIVIITMINFLWKPKMSSPHKQAVINLNTFKWKRSIFMNNWSFYFMETITITMCIVSVWLCGNALVY